MVDVEALREGFVEESINNLDDLEEALLQLEKDDSSPIEIFDRMFRSAHTIKGGSMFFKEISVTQIAEAFEGLLSDLRSGKKTLNTALVQAMFSAVDFLRYEIGISEKSMSSRDEVEAMLRGESVSAKNLEPKDNESEQAPSQQEEEEEEEEEEEVPPDTGSPSPDPSHFMVEGDRR